MNPSSTYTLPGAGRMLRLASVGIIAFALVATSLAWLARAQQVASVVNEVPLRARGAAADVDRYLQSQLLTLEAIASAPTIRSADPVQIRRYFEALDSAALGFNAGIAWVDLTGWMRARTGQNGEPYRGPDLDYSDREHVQQSLANRRSTVSNAFAGTVNPVPLVAFTVVARDQAGSVSGLIVGGIRLDSLQIGSDNLRYAGGTQVLMVDRKGQIIVGQQPMTELRHAADGFELGAMRERGEGALTSTKDPEGNADQLMGFAVVPRSEWLVLVQRSSAEAFSPINAQFAWQAAAITLAAVLVAMLLLWAARRVDRAVNAQSAALAAERRARDALETAVTELEQRQALRDAFVGVMSHELRTPVTTIFGAAKLLAKSPHRADLESLVLDIEEESDRLHRITEDLLVLSRAERGGMIVSPEPVLLQRQVPSISHDLQRRYPSTIFSFDVPEGLPPIAGESGPLRQILNNLLTNAAKYGGGAPVRLAARAVGDAVHLTVEDEGPGFPDGEQEQLFELFFRSASNARSASGTGIGLYVVRQLAQAMGGSVTASPRQPRGAVFTVVLRTYAPESAEIADREAGEPDATPATHGAAALRRPVGDAPSSGSLPPALAPGAAGD